MPVLHDPSRQHPPYELDHDLGLHARAAESIALAQPIATVDELSRLYYVGRSALTELKALATASDINEQY